ncbi:MAG: hypothetical protein M1816_002596 [Peltula sp. TS41687]|nr:MAG: hypothetical protein M1816_002596 [Peltula sp. TS41687]
MLSQVVYEADIFMKNQPLSKVLEDHQKRNDNPYTQLLQVETSRGAYKACQGDTVKKHSEARRGKLLPRNETSGADPNLANLRREAWRYHREFIGSKNAEKRKMVQAKDDSAPEKQRYERLKSSYNRYQRVTGRRNKDGPTKARVDPAQYTPKEVAALHEKHKRFTREYYGSEEAGAKRVRLQSHEGTAEELAEFDDLHNGTAGEYSAEERALLDLYRPGYRIWQKEFKGSENKEKRTRLEAGIGDPEQIARYKEAQDNYHAYEKVRRRHKSKSGKAEIEFDEEHREAIRQLESLRAARNAYVKKYSGPQKAGLRKKLEVRIGSKREVRTHRRLYDAYREFEKIYSQTRRKILRDSVEPSGQGTGEEAEREKILTGSGPVQDGSNQQVKKEKGQRSDGTPNQAVIEQPGEVKNAAGIRAPQAPSSWQRSTGESVNRVSSGGPTPRPNVFLFPGVDFKKFGTAVGTAVNNAASTIQEALSKPSLGGNPGIGKWIPSLPAGEPVIP